MTTARKYRVIETSDLRALRMGGAVAAVVMDPAEVAVNQARMRAVRAEMERIAEICRAHAAELGRQPDCLFCRMESCGRRGMIEKRTAFCPDERWELQPEGNDDGEG